MFTPTYLGWSGGAMVLGKLPVLGVLLIWIIVGQGLIALAVGAGGGCLDIFVLLSFLFFLPLWETDRCRLKYCLKGPLNANQPTNQPNNQPIKQPKPTYKCPISCAIVSPMLGPVSSITAQRLLTSHAPLGLANPVAR